MSDLIEETDTSTSGVGTVTVSIDDNKNKTYDPDDVTPFANNTVVITLVSTGSKQWTFKSSPITIANPHDFSWDPENGGGTTLTVTDSEADKNQNPTHNYTCHVKSNTGDEFDFDPMIKDR